MKEECVARFFLSSIKFLKVRLLTSLCFVHSLSVPVKSVTNIITTVMIYSFDQDEA